jgi:hypothetical protein
MVCKENYNIRKVEKEDDEKPSKEELEKNRRRRIS